MSRLGRQFAGVVDVQDTTLGKDGVEDVEDVFHGSGVVFVSRVQLGEGIDDDEGGFEIGHDLNEIGDIIRLVDDIQGPAQVRRIEDDEIPLIRLGPKGWQFNPLLLEHMHAFKPERVGGVELQVQHPTPRTQGRTT